MSLHDDFYRDFVQPYPEQWAYESPFLEEALEEERVPVVDPWYEAHTPFMEQQKGPVKKTAGQEDPKVTALKAELVGTFGLSAVTDPTGATWTVPQLEKMKRVLARIAAAERAAIKGVELRRLVSTTQFGAWTSGLFHGEIAPGTGIRQDRIEIANEAFEWDKDYENRDADPTFQGEVVQGAPSERTLAHEVGHAVESIAHRQAEEARDKADISRTAAFKTLEKASKAYDDIHKPDVPGWHGEREKKYQEAIKNAYKKLEAITKVKDLIPQPPTAAQSKKGAADVKRALAPARTALAARKAPRMALPRDSTYAMTEVEAAQDAWMAAAEAMVPALEAHAQANKSAEKAQDAEDATQITVKVSSGLRVRMNRRLAEFVGLIEANNIDIVNAGLGNHVTSHWPDKPEEAYADLYSFSLTSPAGLQKFDKKSEVAKYFTSPVGLKRAQKAKADSWLARHQ